MRKNMMQKLSCSFVSTPMDYEIEIQNGIVDDLDRIVPFIQKLGSKVALVTNNEISSLYGEQLRRSLLHCGLETYLFTFEEGEHNKSRQTKEVLEDQMFAKVLGRDTCLIALGGGVVMDMGGYIAATYCRGIPLVMIPTSLLAMVDACIGGKTGVNVQYGKNLVGCIYQPKKVYIDPKFLLTLPLNECRNGVVEMIKHGVVADLNFFEFLETHADQLLALNPPIIGQAIHQSCRIKKEIVEQDVGEIGKRRILNFGHTIGHALEKLYNHQIPHGEVVAIGILVESYLAFLLGHCKLGDLDRIRKILLKYAIPLKLKSRYCTQAIFDAMILDKKSIKGTPRFVIINGIGSTLSFEGNFCTQVEELKIKQSLQWMYDDLCCD